MVQGLTEYTDNIQYSNRSCSGASHSDGFQETGTPSKDKLRTGTELVKLWYNGKRAKTTTKSGY